MNKKFTLSILIIFACFIGNSVYAACPTGDIVLSSQADVDDFASNYSGCTTIPAGVEISVDNLGGSDITNLNGLLVLTAIDGQLEIQNCPGLTTLAGLINITVVNPSGELEISDCNALTSLAGLDNLTSVYDLEIKNNANLTDLTALSNLTEILGELRLKNNDALTSLNGLENVTSVGGNFEVFDNTSLTDCDALCGVINNGAIGGTIDVNNNGGFPCDNFTTWEDNCALIALPVELKSFKGIAMERSNMLKWQTESEENTMVFLVERSLDSGRDFAEIGRVNAFGNSTVLRSYEIEDENPVSLAYYRLRIVDFDGTFEFSDVVAVERSKTDIDLVEVYPIPAEDEVTVLVHAQTEGKAIITLSDFLGRTIKEEKVVLKAGINRYNFNWEEHETNFYYLTIYNGNERIVQKILRASRD
jgi:Secretion system C-terminal sorting domain